MTDFLERGAMVRLPQWEEMPDIPLYMDQVIVLLSRALDGALPGGEVTRSMVNNYVRAGLVPRPQKKKYARAHVALLMMVVVLKQALCMEEIETALRLLCGDSVQAGYARFCAAARGEAAQIDAAARAAVDAAMSTIRAKRMLAAAEEKNPEEK